LRITLLLFLLSFINAQIALPTFQAVHTPHSTSSSSSLYEFTSHTFTNCGATGREGPTLADCKSSYDVSWEDDTDLFNVQTQGVQEWTVPADGTYRIEAFGAQGGAGAGQNSTDGGEGAKMQADFNLNSGTVLKIMVGQQPSSTSSGGGGGTFVVLSNNTALIIAGGGGGGPGIIKAVLFDRTTKVPPPPPLEVLEGC
jgi:hypothetical protein